MPVAPGRAGVKQEMHKFKQGELHSGSKHGKVVTNPKQAIAIALHEAGLSKEDAASRPHHSNEHMRKGYRKVE